MSDEELLQLLLQEKFDQLQNIYSVPDDKDIIKKQLTALQKVKKDLEVIYLLAPYLFSCLSDDKKNILIGLHDIINRDLSETDKLFIRTWLKNNNFNIYDELGNSYD